MSATCTYVACLTPPGTGAIATVGVVGPDAWRAVAPLLRPPLDPGKLTNHSFRLQALGVEGQTDQVVVTLDQDGALQRVELHCHGGLAVVRWILDLLRARGAVELDWQDWLKRISTSTLRASANIALARALTSRTAAILLDQCHGALESAVREVLGFLRAGDLTGALKALGSVVQRVPLGQHLTAPWRVVLAGAPNAGKSTLMNALVGYQRSIISPLPGTTRDTLAAVTALDGWPVEIMDTAGMQAAAFGIEAVGMEKSSEALAAADLALWLLDTSKPPEFPRDRLPGPVIWVRSKVDLPSVWAPTEWPTPLHPLVHVSARTGEGFTALCQAIPQALVPGLPPPGAAVPTDETTCDALRMALQLLNSRKVKAAYAVLAGLIRPTEGTSLIATDSQLS